MNKPIEITVILVKDGGKNIGVEIEMGSEKTAHLFRIFNQDVLPGVRVGKVGLKGFNFTDQTPIEYGRETVFHQVFHETQQQGDSYDD
jgi:hypothetical protein